MGPPQSLFDEIRRLHGHYCPMSTLGGRLGFAARARLSASGALCAEYFIATCAADGVSVATGCDLADGSLRVTNRGRHALWLTDQSGRGVFAELSDRTLATAGEYRALDQALERDRDNLDSEELARRLAEKEQFLNNLLQRLRQLPDDELIDFDECLPADL